MPVHILTFSSVSILVLVDLARESAGLAELPSNGWRYRQGGIRRLMVFPAKSAMEAEFPKV
jgi:hypothetical protein